MFPHHLRQTRREPPPDTPEPRRAGVLTLFFRFLGYLILLGAIVVGGIALGPGLPDRLDPFADLDPAAAPNFLTGFKLDRATATPEACFAALGRIDDIRYVRLQDRIVSDECRIEGHTELRGLTRARLDPVSTRCAIALRLYMWDRHSVQPAARAFLGTGVSGYGHFASFSCRPIRTENGDGPQMSQHATGNAIDISSVILDDRRELTVLDGWTSDDRVERAFWQAIRQGACRWFNAVLSPDFNALHQDHFHLDEGPFTACR